MPPVTTFTIAYGAGLWVGLAFRPPLVAAIAATLFGTASVRWIRWRGVLIAAVAAGATVGSAHAGRRSRQCAAVWAPGRRTAIVRIHDAAGPGGRTDATVLWTRAGCDGPLLLATSDAAISAGVRAIIVGAYRGRGIIHVARVRILDGRRPMRFVIRDALRRRIASLYGARAPIVEALVVGRRYDISKELRNRFADSGLAHLLAISGLHVGIVAAWLLVLCRICGAGTLGPALAAIGTWAYVSLLGFPPPATRAATFVTLYAVSRARQRHPPTDATLAVAVLVVLTVDPEAATAVGAWLSVAAVAGTAWGQRVVPDRWRRFPVVHLAAASVGAVLFTAPITAGAFGSVSPAGVVTNLLAVPLATAAVPTVLLSLIIGAPAAAGAGLALSGVEIVARIGSRIPGGHVTGVAGARFALPWLGLVLGSIWLRRRGLAASRPVFRLAGIGAAAAWAALALPSLHGAPRGLVITVLNVGQGDAIAIRTPHGHWVQVDAGPRTAVRDAGRRIVTPFLRRAGVDRLDALVASHGDADHLGGVPAVLSGVGTELMIEPGQPLPTPLYREYLGAVEEDGVPWMPARAGDTLVVDSVVFAVLHPRAAWLARKFEPNENSVVLRMQFRCFSALFTGDAGAPVESLLAPTVGAIDMLKVGHHGSASATTERWLDAVRPKVAVISVGPNTYGHPSPEVLARLRRHGISVWRTDRDGTVTVRSDGRYLSIQGTPHTSLMEEVRCRIRRLLRSSDSSSIRNACTPRPQVTLPICSTTSPSPRR